MSADRSIERDFQDELLSIIDRKRRSADDQSRSELFDALSRLERRALVAGASDRIIREIAETRFLAGILRHAVRPTRSVSLRSILRTRERTRPAPQRGTRRRPETVG